MDVLVKYYAKNNSLFLPPIWAEKRNSVYRTINSFKILILNFIQRT